MPVLNLVKLPMTAVDLSPGSRLLIDNVTWEQYEALLGEDRRVPRINYCNGTLELMSPLPAHERPHRIIAYIVTVLLDAQNRAWEDFGYDNDRLTIYLLQNNQYQISPRSRVFPQIPIATAIPEWVQDAIRRGTSTMLRDLRERLQAGDEIG